LSVPVSAAPAFLPNMPFRLDADFVPVIKIRPNTTFWSPISPGRPSQSPELVALLNSQPDILIRPLKREMEWRDRRPPVSSNRHPHGATDVRLRSDEPQADQHQYAG
jgi:hypothetical protein